jgi:alpha-ketoglutarate-dependent taurine dioxygenase
MEQVALSVKQGAGLAFVSGLPAAAFSTDALRMIFWGLSAQLGKALSQSGRGDRLGEVQARPDAERGYLNDAELDFHCDLSEIFGLFCVQDARQGGENLFVSMLRAREILAREHPDFLQILERGFRLDRSPDSQQFETEPITPGPVPLFSVHLGLRSCWLTTVERATRTAQALGTALAEEEHAALACLAGILRREDMILKTTLRPGDMVFVNNYEVVHARSSFVQYEDRPRHLLRIWVQASPPRPMRPDIAVYQNRSGLQGLDPKDGWGPDAYVRRPSHANG